MKSRILLAACGIGALAVIALAPWSLAPREDRSPDVAPVVVPAPQGALADEMARRDAVIDAQSARIAMLEARVEELSSALARREAEATSAAEELAPTAYAVSLGGTASISLSAAQWLARIGGDRFAGMTEAQAQELRELDLRGLQVTDADLVLLEGLPNLRTL